MQKSNTLSEYESELREYYLKCFISEFSKIIIFFIISLPLGLVKEFFVALILLMVLRNIGGGLHFNHYLSCLFVSFLFLYGSIFLAQYIQPGKALICVCTMIFSVIAYHLVPITSSNRPDATDIQVRRCKKKTVISILFLFVLMCICPITIYSYICFWTIALHILQLLIAHLRKEAKRNV